MIVPYLQSGLLMRRPTRVAPRECMTRLRPWYGMGVFCCLRFRAVPEGRSQWSPVFATGEFARQMASTVLVGEA